MSPSAGESRRPGPPGPDSWSTRAAEGGEEGAGTRTGRKRNTPVAADGRAARLRPQRPPGFPPAPHPAGNGEAAGVVPGRRCPRRARPAPSPPAPSQPGTGAPAGPGRRAGAAAATPRRDAPGGPGAPLLRPPPPQRPAAERAARPRRTPRAGRGGGPAGDARGVGGPRRGEEKTVDRGERDRERGGRERERRGSPRPPLPPPRGGRDKPLCRGLTFNRSQRGSCSATYETPTQKQVVYEWFSARFPTNVRCVTGEGAASFPAAPRFPGRGALRTGPRSRRAAGHATPRGARAAARRRGRRGTGYPRPTEAPRRCRIVPPGRDSDLEAFSHNPTDGSFAPLAPQPSTYTKCLNLRFLSY